MSNLTLDFETAKQISDRSFRSIKTNIFCLLLLAGILISVPKTVFSQQHTDDNLDQNLRGRGGVNGSTLGLEINIPLGTYPGRGIDVPVSISYSSKVWRTEFIDSQPRINNPESCIQINTVKYSEHSVSGWNSSTAAPYIEYTGSDNLYNEKGFALSPSCVTQTDEQGQTLRRAYVKRITVHLPGAESHELRASDAVFIFPQSTQNTAFDFDGTFYSVDSTNLRYVESSEKNSFKLMLPNGSFYLFSPSKSRLSGPDSPIVRKAVSYTDRNGNTLQYEPSSNLLIDTLGRQLSSPFGSQPPETPTVEGNPHIYRLPGLHGSSIEFKFHWKRLNGGSQSESALTDITHPDYQLQHIADRDSVDPNATPRADGYLFESKWNAWVHDEGKPQFNPVVLTKVELPSGLSYQFSYDHFGRIERIVYPTGAKEHVVYDVVPAISPSEPDNVFDQTNFGVIERRQYADPLENEFYKWTYQAQRLVSAGFKVTTTSPQKIKTERYIIRDPDPDPDANFGDFGFGNGLSGLSFEEKVFNRTDKLISLKKIHYTKNSQPIANAPGTSRLADWHPRIESVESNVYDSQTGVGLKAIVRNEYENEPDLEKIQTAVLLKKVIEHGYEEIENSLTTAGFREDEDPLPTPDDIPNSQNIIRSSESVFLINDPSIAQLERKLYADKNLVGLVTSKEIRDFAGRVVSQTRYAYDQPGLSPFTAAGNLTSSSVWDSSQGDPSSVGTYLATSAKYDDFGNVIEITDPNGHLSVTEFDSVHHTFPLKKLTPIPDPAGTKGSNTPHEFERTFDPHTGLVIKSKDENGIETRFEYDPATLRLIENQKFLNNVPVGGKKEYFFDDSPGRMVVSERSQIDESNWSESLSYFDGLGRIKMTEKKHSAGSIFLLNEFDSEGRLYRVSNPFRFGQEKKWTTNQYDDSGRLIRVTGPDGTFVTTNFGVLASDKKGTSITVTDQAGRSRTGVVDAAGNMVRVIEDPFGETLVTDYVFDALDHVRETVQGTQHRYFYFDSLGRLIYSKQPEENTNSSFVAIDMQTGNAAWSKKVEYDGNGNLVRVTDARGIQVSVDYDALDRPIRRSYSDGTPDVDFYYDGTGLESMPLRAKGKLTKTSSASAETRSKAFDQLGRVVEYEQSVGENVFRTRYEYSLSGRLSAEVYPSDRRLEYNANEDGELALVRGVKPGESLKKAYVSGIKRNAAGLITGFRLGNGLWHTADFNSREQVTSLGLGHSEPDSSILQLNFGYGGASNNGSLRTQSIGFSGLKTPIDQEYLYDPLNRIRTVVETVGKNETWRETFNYDRFGNRRIDESGRTTFFYSDKKSNPEIDSKTNSLRNYQDEDKIADYEYDDVGNLTADAYNQRFVYNAENQQTTFFSGVNTSNVPDATYEYDGNGRRIKKTTSEGDFVFVYNAFGKLIAEYSYNVPASPGISYLTKDHLGSTRVVTNGAGIVTSREDFMAFGESTIASIGLRSGRSTSQGYGSEISLRERFTGYERDRESGLDYAQARYYNPVHGRFTSLDPIPASSTLRDPQTFNRYSYVLNNPYKFVDPLGLISRSTGACGQFCVNTIGGGFDGGTDFDNVTAKVDSLNTATESQNRRLSGAARIDESQIFPPQVFIAEATERLVSVVLQGDGYEKIQGYLVMTRELSELWINALVGGFSRGFEVGAAATAVSGVTAKSGLTESASASFNLGGQINKQGPSGGLNVGWGKNASVSTSSFTEIALRLDVEARIRNSTSAIGAAGVLQDQSFEVSTAYGTITAKAEMGFFNREFSREVDLIYRRGMAMGRSNTSGKPAVTDQSTVLSNQD